MASPLITSPRSPRVVAARRLATRAFRAKQGLFLAEGPQAVREAVAFGEAATHGTTASPDATARPGETGTPGKATVRGAGVVELYYTAAAAERYPQIIDAAGAVGAALLPTTEEVVASLSDTVHPQGMVAVCRFLDEPADAILARSPRLVVLLAHVRDPGNVGSVIRAADAAGADAVLVSDESVDVYNPKAVRATVGSLFHLPIAVGVPMAAAVAECRAAGLRVLAADGSGALDLDDEADSGALRAPTCWMFGNEAWGLPEELRSLADAAVRVPIHGRAESLNLSTAAAVCLYASARAQRK